MPDIGRPSKYQDASPISKESLNTSRTQSDLGRHGSAYAVHAQPRLRRPRTMLMTNSSASLFPIASEGNALGQRHKAREAKRSLPSPESSPERPPRTRKASNRQTRESAPVILTPPPSDDENENSSRTQVSESDHSLDFPLDRRPLPTTHYSTSAITGTKDQISSRRTVSAGNRRLDPKPSTDRFITTRPSAWDLSHAFRASKATQDLTNSEKLLRDTFVSPDPFGPLILPPMMEQRASGFRGRGGLAETNRNRSRTIGTLHTIALPQDISAPQNRQVSAGAVWNVGGSAQASQPGPVRAVPNGRGGFLSSGSNAPMYTAEFLDQRSANQEIETLESRVARALDIDRTERLINTNRSTRVFRGASTGSVGLQNRHSRNEPRTKWINGEWVRSCSSLLDAPMLRDDYYCSVLAYCTTLRTLAVGLANRVYLWSEDFGVKYPPGDSSNRLTTYVTSLSFSSTQGGNSILAIGRNTGQICLWSLDDDEDIRFKAQQPTAIACVLFKPVTTHRPSERFGSIVATEELLVGDETGDIYYYSIEWMTRNQVEIHGWIGSMKLLAKISMHSQQICGLAWSPSGEYFATGANDNACCLFQVNDILKQESPPDSAAFYRRPLQSIIDGLGLPSYPTAGTPPPILTSLSELVVPGTSSYRSLSNAAGPLSILQRASVIPGQGGSLLIGDGRQKHKWIHSAAVKAIAFCPWQRGLIATGGGSNDRAIHFYHTFSGACLATINVHAQVTSLIWSTTRREIAATFGYAQPEHPYRIAVFSWPECKQIVAIPWQSDMRALLAIPYPRGPGETRCHTRLGEQWYSRTAQEGCLVIACSDESVKFHEVWSGAAKATRSSAGLLGGSAILEGLEGIEGETAEVIR